MEFFDVINTRKTIRKYTQDIPPEADIKKIADAGRLAPSATNSQNWKFIAVCNQEVKEKMAKAVNDKYDCFLNLVKSHAADAGSAALEGASTQKQQQAEEDCAKINGSRFFATFFTNAPVVFVIVETPRDSGTMGILERNGMGKEELKKLDNRASILSMGGAIENMSLAAHALGYGTCWMCAPLVAAEEFGEILNIKPDEGKVVTLLTVGVPAPPKAPVESADGSVPQKPVRAPKKPLEEVFEIV